MRFYDFPLGGVGGLSGLSKVGVAALEMIIQPAC